MINMSVNEDKIKKIVEDIQSGFKITPELAFKIYDLLKKEVPELSSKFPVKSAFFTYLNEKL